jgi:hypothetical protein
MNASESGTSRDAQRSSVQRSDSMLWNDPIPTNPTPYHNPIHMNLQLTLPDNHRAPPGHTLHRLLDHLIHNLLGALPLIHHRSRLPHQERPRIIHRLIIHIIAHLLKIVLHGDRSLLRELLDLGRAVLLPVLDVWIVAHAQRAAGEDDGADVVVEAGGADGFLVGFGCSGFLREDEARADPDGGGAEHEGRGERLAVEETAGGDALHGLARHWGFGFGAHLGNGGDQDGRWDVASVAAAFATLCADDVCADVEAFFDVFWVADHVHVEDAGFVEAVDDGFGRDSNGGDEEFGARVDDDGHEVVKLAFGIVVAAQSLTQ